ncbi:radical SAM protein [Labilibacter marinus]|uniref:radical SAM protein n=1 Tax=Labilibacter marinus TaxID=1477105 RepID=UPI00094FA974|nr:radical SAM protein [Labilibacter marinus]
MSTLSYDEPVFRPPAEAASVILQATIGCAWNNCAFCEMYKSKKFKTRSLQDLKEEIKVLSLIYKGTKKVFLADGNAMVLSASKLLPILAEINNNFGKIQRISSYALPKDILSKSVVELKELRNLGLKLLYIGIESGDNELLKLLNKGETFQSTKEGILRAHEAGIDTSVMILNGLGGVEGSKQHAMRSAQLVNALNPKFLSTLNLSFPYGLEHFKKRYNATFTPLSVLEILEEMKLFISELSVTGTIYRSDHVSNQLILKGNLPRDKKRILLQIEEAINAMPSNIYPNEPMML